MRRRFVTPNCPELVTTRVTREPRPKNSSLLAAVDTLASALRIGERLPELLHRRSAGQSGFLWSRHRPRKVSEHRYPSGSEHQHSLLGATPCACSLSS